MPRRFIEVWLCPNEDCGHYYAASSIEGQDLSTHMNRDLKGHKTFNRAQCPICKTPKERRRAFIMGE